MFKKAVPVFAKGKEWEKNTHIMLRAEVESLRDCTLSLAAVSFYRLIVNGKFVAFGPARAAKGYARIDIHELSSYDRLEGKNEIFKYKSPFRP